jgi:hypothetical protein
VAVSKSEWLPEDGQVGPKYVAVIVILMLLWNKKRLTKVALGMEASV